MKIFNREFDLNDIAQIIGLALILMFSSIGCNVQDLQAPTNPGQQFSAGPTPTPTGTPEAGFESVDFTFENIDFWYYASTQYPDYAFSQWVTGTAIAPLYYHKWSKWQVGYKTNSDPNEVPNPILVTLICIEDDTQRARALQGLSYNVVGYTSFGADATVAAMNSHYTIESEVVSLSPITCRFTVTEIQ